MCLEDTTPDTITAGLKYNKRGCPNVFGVRYMTNIGHKALHIPVITRTLTVTLVIEFRNNSLFTVQRALQNTPAESVAQPC